MHYEEHELYRGKYTSSNASSIFFSNWVNKVCNSAGGGLNGVMSRTEEVILVIEWKFRGQNCRNSMIAGF